MARHISGSNTGLVCAVTMALALSLSGCASDGTTKTISTLAGSSAGAAAGRAIGASGAWGYVATIASSALGGFAGNQVTRLFGGNQLDQQDGALKTVLNASEATKTADWGATDGKSPGGYVQATGPVFASGAGKTCRSFMMVTYKQGSLMGSLDPAAIKQGMGAIQDAKSSVSKLSDVNSVGDAVAAGKSAAGAVDQAKGVVSSLAPTDAAQTPAPAAKAPVASELFGTACKDAKAGWQIVKAKA